MDFTLREMVLTGSIEATFDKCFEDSWAALNWVSSMKSLRVSKLVLTSIIGTK